MGERNDWTGAQWEAWAAAMFDVRYWLEGQMADCDALMAGHTASDGHHDSEWAIHCATRNGFQRTYDAIDVMMGPAPSGVQESEGGDGNA